MFDYGWIDTLGLVVGGWLLMFDVYVFFRCFPVCFYLRVGWFAFELIVGRFFYVILGWFALGVWFGFCCFVVL